MLICIKRKQKKSLIDELLQENKKYLFTKLIKLKIVFISYSYYKMIHIYKLHLHKIINFIGTFCYYLSNYSLNDIIFNVYIVGSWCSFEKEKKGKKSYKLAKNILFC